MVTVTLVGWRTNTELVFLGLADSVAAASSPVLPCLVSALLCPLWEGAALGLGCAQVSQSHLCPILVLMSWFGAACKCLGLSPAWAVMRQRLFLGEMAPNW